MKEQFAPEDNRDIASFNTDNEFNRAINEEDIDPGLPHSAVKQLHGASVRDLIQKIENRHRHALQRHLQQRQQFNPFSKESKDMIHDVGNIELCELLDVEPKAQCKICLSYWDVGIVYCTCGHLLRNGTEDKQEICQVSLSISSRFPITTSRRSDTTGTVTGRSQGITSTTSRIRPRRNARRETSWVSTTGTSAMRSSARICLTLVAMKKHVVRWTNWRTKTTRTASLKMKFESVETIGGFVRTKLVLIQCQSGTDLTSSKHCLPYDS